MKKLLKVINSMSNILQIDATRKYIDLYYKQFGETRKDVIEYYFRNKKKKFEELRSNGRTERDINNLYR